MTAFKLTRFIILLLIPLKEHREIRNKEEVVLLFQRKVKKVPKVKEVCKSKLTNSWTKTAKTSCLNSLNSSKCKEHSSRKSSNLYKQLTNHSTDRNNHLSPQSTCNLSQVPNNQEQSVLESQQRNQYLLENHPASQAVNNNSVSILKDGVILPRTLGKSPPLCNWPQVTQRQSG